MEDIRRLQAVNGDCLHSTLNLDGIGLITPVEDSVWADIWDLERSRRAPCRIYTCEAVARSMKMNRDGAACRVAGTGRSYPMWTLSRDATSVHSVREGAKNCLVTAGENCALVPLMRFSSPPSMQCESPIGSMVELRTNVYRHGT
jgi:hypothetical protein